jgi:hypothetical protein
MPELNVTQGHEGEGKKDEEYYCMFGNRANDIGQGRVVVTANGLFA